MYYTILRSEKYSYYTKHIDTFTKNLLEKIFTKDKLTSYLEKNVYNIALSFREVETKLEEKKNEETLKEFIKELEVPTLFEAGEFYYREMTRERKKNLKIL